MIVYHKKHVKGEKKSITKSNKKALGRVTKKTKCLTKSNKIFLQSLGFKI